MNPIRPIRRIAGILAAAACALAALATASPAMAATVRAPHYGPPAGTLLPRTAGLISVTAIGASGQALEPQDLSGREQAWQRFQHRTGGPPA